MYFYMHIPCMIPAISEEGGITEGQVPSYIAVLGSIHITFSTYVSGTHQDTLKKYPDVCCGRAREVHKLSALSFGPHLLYFPLGLTQKWSL